MTCNSLICRPKPAAPVNPTEERTRTPQNSVIKHKITAKKRHDNSVEYVFWMGFFFFLNTKNILYWDIAN